MHLPRCRQGVGHELEGIERCGHAEAVVLPGQVVGIASDDLRGADGDALGQALARHRDLHLRGIEAGHVADILGVVGEETGRTAADVEQLVVRLEVELGGHGPVEGPVGPLYEPRAEAP